MRADITCFGKIIGGGLPVGAFGGRREVMRELAPEGPCYQGGTLSGNPLATAAGLAVMGELAREGVYERLEASGAALEEAVRASGAPVHVNRVGSMLTPFFTHGPVEDYADATRSDTDAYGRFARALLDEGVYPPPSQFEAWFTGLTHGDARDRRRPRGARPGGRGVRDVLADEPALAAELIEPAAAPLLSPLVSPAAHPPRGGRPRPDPRGLPAAPRAGAPPDALRARPGGARRRLLLRPRPRAHHRGGRPLRGRGPGRPDRPGRRAGRRRATTRRCCRCGAARPPRSPPGAGRTRPRPAPPSSPRRAPCARTATPPGSPRSPMAFPRRPDWSRLSPDEGSPRLGEDPREGRRAAARHRAGRSEARDHGDRRPRLQGRRPRPAVHRRRRQPPAGADQPVRHGPAHVHGARHREPRRARGAHRDADGPAAPAGRGGQDEGARQAARAGVLLVEDGQGRALPGGVARRARPRPAADPHLLARRRRPLHHAAAGLQQGPGDRGAQLRHVPHPEG